MSRRFQVRGANGLQIYIRDGWVRLYTMNAADWSDRYPLIVEESASTALHNIEKLLRVMEQELSVFDRGERPDYEVFGAIIEFFKKYPDSCHHPKEDIIYEKFKTRDPDRAASISDLEAEHREGAVRLRRVAHAIEKVLNDEEVLREGIHRIVRDFIDNERQHIALEEQVVFPAIVDTLQPEDWADVALTLADRYGPPSPADFEEGFNTLRRSILELQEAAVARRSY